MIGLRYRIVLALIGLTVALGLPLSASADAAKHAKSCPSGQVRRTLTYVHRQGGPVDHATGCVVKNVIVPKTFAAIQARIRSLASTFVPPAVARAFRDKAARQVAAADAKTDAALGADLSAPPPQPQPLARTARLARPADGTAKASEAATETKYLHQEANLDTADDTGHSYVTGSFTRGTRVKGPNAASSKKTLTIKHLINKCPDADGIAHGTLDFELSDQRIDGPRTITETSTAHLQILAHFDESARIASVDVTGHWSFAIGTRHTNRSVGGNVSASNFRQTDGTNYFDLPTTVTTGTDDDIVTGGAPLGAWVAEGLIHEYVENVLRSIPKGVCVNIVPDPPTVHVAPGKSVAIVAHLTDHHGQTFPGSITASNSPDPVSPAKADGNPDARFTYTAPASAKPGDTDIVQLGHVSKRGKGIGGLVNVVIDKKLPKRFDGTWTEVRTEPSVRPGWLEELHGAASFVLDSTPGPVCLYCDSYELEHSSVQWTVSGSDNPSGECKNSYQGSGSTEAVNSYSAGSTLNIEETGVPNSYYYSIFAQGDPEKSLLYDVIHTPSACAFNFQESISNYFLTVGPFADPSLGSPGEETQTSADLLHLDGHHVGEDQFGFTVDDTWSFTGSG